MEMPIGDFLDRYSIVKLKHKYTKGENDEEFQAFHREFLFIIAKHSEWTLLTYFEALYDINKEIWGYEADLRRGNTNMQLEDIGLAAINIRNANRLRKRIINELVDLTGQGFKDIKMNHASEEISNACSS